MNPIEQACDRQQVDTFLDDYLDDRLDDSALAAFEAHLTNCDSCQTELQRRAAEPEVWRDAAELLGSGVSSSSVQLASGAGHEQGAADLQGAAECYNDDASGSRERGNKYQDEGKSRQQVLSVLDSLTPTDDPEMLGRIGDYEVSGVVGVGGMGAVLKGFDKSLRRVVAIKVMAPHLAGSGPARTRFQREARAAAAITHDNVIDTYGVSEANGLPYLVMPFARGPSLQKRIDESGPLTATEVVRIGRQIASGLAAAHEQGLVHRDIKPANILLNEGIERLWITDFGVARAMDDASMTQTGLIAGTPQYMSPEQARGETVDHRSDLFSLGSILYTACTGRPPFRSEAAYGILRRITDTDPRPIQELNAEVPDWLCQVIDRLMAKHPADRFQSADDVAELLEGCLAHLQQPTQVALPSCVSFPKQAVEAVPQTLNRQSEKAIESRPSRLKRTGIWIMISSLLLAGIGLVTFQLTNPVELSGDWAGENWNDVSLSSTSEASGWYTGSFTDAQGRRGALQLEWSRLQRRYNGRWKVGDEQAGSITLRAVNVQRVRGAIAVDADSKVADDMPRLREFSWQRTSATAEAEYGTETADAGTAGLANDEPITSDPFSSPADQAPDTSIGTSLTADAPVETTSPETTSQETTAPGISSPSESIAPRQLTSNGASLNSASPGTSIGSTFGPASDLAQRIREATLGVESTESGILRIEDGIAKIDQEIESLESELANQNDRGGNTNATFQNEGMLSSKRSELQTLSLVLEGQRLELKNLRAQLTQAENERSVIIEILRAQLEAAIQRREAQERLSEIAKRHFETGDASVDEVLKAEQSTVATVSEIRQLELMLEYYKNLGSREPNPINRVEPILNSIEGLGRASYEKERQAIVEILTAQREAEVARLEQAKLVFARQQDLFNKSLISQSNLDEARLRLVEGEAAVKEFDVRIEYFRSQEFDNR